MSTAARKSMPRGPADPLLADPLLAEVTRARTALCLFDMNTAAAISPRSGGALDLIAEYLNDGEFRATVRCLAIETLAKSLNAIEELRQTELKRKPAGLAPKAVA